MPNGNITIDKGVITSQTDNPDGSISIKAQLPCNQDITLTATPNSGYTLEYIKKNGVAQSGIVPAGDSIVFDSDGEPTINVRFKKTIAAPPTTFKIKVFCDLAVFFRFSPNGTIYRGDIQGEQGGAGPGQFGVEQTYNSGDTLNIYTGITADAWMNLLSPQELLALTIISDTPYTVAPNIIGRQNATFSTVVNRNMNIIIQARLLGALTKYNVSASSNAGGIVSPVSTQVNANTPATVVITPAPGYRIASIRQNGVFVTGSVPNTGGTLTIPSVLQNIEVIVTFELITGNISTALISRIVYSRLIGSATQATAWSDSSYIDATPTYLPGGRRLFSNGIQVVPFNLPYTYAGTYLRTEVDFTTGDVAIDEFIDSQSNNYLRLAIDSIGKDGNDLKINTRLNNVYGNSGNGFSAGQVSLCQLKITNPDGVETTFNHPVTTAGYRVTDILHSYTLTKIGVYILEAEAKLLSGLRTSYCKTFVTVSPA